VTTRSTTTNASRPPRVANRACHLFQALGRQTHLVRLHEGLYTFSPLIIRTRPRDIGRPGKAHTSIGTAMTVLA